MTEMIEATEPKLAEALEGFVLGWGDLGSQWGVNRSIAQVHAFLYLQERPVTAEDIAEAFGMARSNVSNSLRELMAWRLIKRVPVRGDRRDHFIAETDVWEIAARIAEGRKQREIDPALVTLRETLAQADHDPSVSEVQRERLRAMADATASMDRWFDRLVRVPPGRRNALLRLMDRVLSMLPSGSERT